MSAHETTFYDQHPFDWTEGYTRQEVEATLAPPLASFIAEIPSNAVVLDLGCGAGRVMSCLAARGLRAVGLDLSFASVRLMAQRTGKTGMVGDGMRLPVAEGSIDRVIADGVIRLELSFCLLQPRAVARYCSLRRKPKQETQAVSAMAMFYQLTTDPVSTIDQTNQSVGGRIT